MLKSLNETLPSHVSIKKIALIDSNKSEKDLKNLTLFFSNNNDGDNANKDFKTLYYHNNKALEMTCLCCLTEGSFNQLRNIDNCSDTLEMQIYFEAKNQFNVITEMNLRANFEIFSMEDKNSSKYIKLKLLDEYSNITKTYEI